MSIKFGLYRCKVCGNIAQVLLNGEGELICCGEEMELMDPQYTKNEIGEKHVPQIETLHEGCETGVCQEKKYVTLRKHPMIKEHYIQFIEVFNKEKNELKIKFFRPEEDAKYNVTDFDKEFTALELCNVHGLWRNKND